MGRPPMSDQPATPPGGLGTQRPTPRRALARKARPRSRILDVAALSRYRRRKLFRAIEAETRRKLLAYVSCGRAIDEVDAFDLVRLLETVVPGVRITLLLESPGGDVDAAEKMVHVLREACAPLAGSAGDLEVVVPNGAKSAATLVALGADRILMSDSSELGPIDPQLQVSGGGSVPVFALIRAYEEAEQRCLHTAPGQQSVRGRARQVRPNPCRGDAASGRESMHMRRELAEAAGRELHGGVQCANGHSPFPFAWPDDRLARREGHRDSSRPSLGKGRPALAALLAPVPLLAARLW